MKNYHTSSRCRRLAGLTRRRNRVTMPRRGGSWRQLGCDARRMGAAAVEFAIVANVMFVLIFTCIEFARLNMVRNLAQDAAYFAARQAIVPGATAAEAEEVADNIMSSLLANGYEITVSELGSESSEISVTVGVELHDVALFLPLFLPDSTIETTATMRTERNENFFRL